MVVQNNTISPNEEATIRNWVNKKYGGQSEAYKNAAYKDAYNAVLQRKADYQTKLANENKRKTNAEIASYNGKDKVMKEKAKLAKAELAISDAADLIREGQRANGATVNNKLTDKQLVDSFLLANNGKPYAEYVSKYINDNMNGNTGTNNLWLASKLGLDTGTTMGIDNRTLVNAMDKGNAGLRGFGQGLVNLTQNTIGAGANYLGSNIGAGLGELGYALANAFGADTSKGSVWDKLKKAEGYSWSQAKDAANSKLGEGVLSEDQGAYNIGENLGELTSEIALTAPLELGVGSAIKAGKIGKTALDLSKAGKWGLQAANAGLAGAGFQLADDAAKGELSSPEDYIVSSLVGAGTAGIGNALGKTAKIIKKTPVSVFGSKGQIENAILKKTPEEWDKMSKISEQYAKDINEGVTPRTEIAKSMGEAKEAVYQERLSAGKKLQEVRNNLKFKGNTNADKFLRQDVVDTINKSIEALSSKTKYGSKAANKTLLPKFRIEGNNLTMSKEDFKLLNQFSRNENNKTVKLGDKIRDAFKETYGLGAKDSAASTELFIRKLKSLVGDSGWSGGPENMIKVVKDGLDNATKKFEKRLSSQSKKALKEASEYDKNIIELDDEFESLFTKDSNGVRDVKSADKALKGGAGQEQLFKKVKELTSKLGNEKDLNNEILAWAKNLSLYDTTKAKDLLNFFYPSKAGVIETGIKAITQPLQKRATKQQIKNGVRTTAINTNTKPSTNTIMNELGNVVNKERKE